MISIAELSGWRNDARLRELEERATQVPREASLRERNRTVLTTRVAEARRVYMQLQARAEVGDPAVNKRDVEQAAATLRSAEEALQNVATDDEFVDLKVRVLHEAAAKRRGELLDVMAAQVVAEAEPLTLDIVKGLAALLPKIDRLNALANCTDNAFDTNVPGCRGFASHAGRQLPFGVIARAVGPLRSHLAQSVAHAREHGFKSLPAVSPESVP